MLDAIYARRTVRLYKPDVVDEPRLRLLLDAAVHAPTAMRAEPWQFVVVQDRTVLKRISDRAKELAVSDARARGRLLKLHGAAGDGIPSPFADPTFNVFYDAGTLVVICAPTAAEFSAADCWLAAANVMLAAPTQGLGTACIGVSLPALNTPEIKAELDIPEESTAYVGIIVGVPRPGAMPSSRKPPVVLRWIR